MNDQPRSTLDLQPVTLGTWTAFSRNAIPFIVASAVVVLGVTLSFTLLTGPLLVGMIHMSTRALNGEPVELRHLGEGFTKIGKPILTWLILLVAVSLGLLLLVLPGIVLSLLWLYAFWFVAQEDELPSDALRSSWRLVRAHLPSTILLALMLVVLNVVGSFLVVGVFIALPLSVLLMTASFEQLTAPSPAEARPPEPATAAAPAEAEPPESAAPESARPEEKAPGGEAE